MSQSMIEKLKKQSPEQRAALMEKTYKKNLDFFRKNHPALLSAVENVKCPYSFNMTEDFVEIVDERSGKLAHPSNLDRFSEMLGDWVHNAWVDLVNFKVVSPEQYPIHNAPVKQFSRELMCGFPEYLIRFAQKKINLKELSEDSKFSPPTIFLGVFHGLHIDYYLSRTDLAYLLFVEPDLERFEVSCYFLDYEAIRDKLGTFLMSVGDGVETYPIRSFFSNYHASRHMWTRVLPAYETTHNAYFIEAFKTFQTSLASVIFPIDSEILGLQQAVRNIQRQFPILSTRTKLSRKAKIAVVATGPSLNNDLEWLEKNQDKLIICAVQSAVKVLSTYGIRPDFQFSMETRMVQDGLDILQMHRDVPTILYYKAPALLTDFFEIPLLCPTDGKANPIRAKQQLEYVAPSTANLMVAFALFGQPSSIFFLGCDFGFIDLAKNHATGGVYDSKGEGEEHLAIPTQLTNMSQSLVEANFPETNLVQTTPFLTHTRISIQEALAAKGTGIECVNLSNGAKVKGTVAGRSAKIRLKSYPHKKKDIDCLLKMFQVPQKNKNWFAYAITGEKLVESFKAEFFENLKMEEFSWAAFNRVVDYSLQDAIAACREDESDGRLDIFVRFFVDILSSWYSTVIFFDDVKKAEEVYRFGLKKIEKIIEEITWPVDEIA